MIPWRNVWDVSEMPAIVRGVVETGVTFLRSSRVGRSIGFGAGVSGGGCVSSATVADGAGSGDGASISKKSGNPELPPIVSMLPHEGKVTSCSFSNGTSGSDFCGFLRRKTRPSNVSAMMMKGIS